jgi:hypothetical protein
MIKSKELALVNEVIRHLEYETLEYTKIDSYVHPN